MDYSLQINNLKKSYGQVQAVKGISFDIRKGEVFALIGPNGAGKTTTIRMIATLLTPDSGEIMVGGIDVKAQPLKAREQITYLPDEAGAYKTMTGEGYLNFMSSLFTDDKELAARRCETAKQLCGLGDRIKDKIGSYSRGMTRKLLLARAVMTVPTLAVLDEPTSGLDIINALEIRKNIRALAGAGMSFLLSSHNMLEIEFVSDRVGIIHKGVLLETGTPAELKAKHNASNLEDVFEQVVRTIS